MSFYLLTQYVHNKLHSHTHIHIMAEGIRCTVEPGFKRVIPNNVQISLSLSKMFMLYLTAYYTIHAHSPNISLIEYTLYPHIVNDCRSITETVHTASTTQIHLVVWTQLNYTKRVDPLSFSKSRFGCTIKLQVFEPLPSQHIVH
jgi:hypothetical protein